VYRDSRGRCQNARRQSHEPSGAEPQDVRTQYGGRDKKFHYPIDLSLFGRWARVQHSLLLINYQLAQQKSRNSVVRAEGLIILTRIHVCIFEIQLPKYTIRFGTDSFR
jgi:hypothetical protein